MPAVICVTNTDRANWAGQAIQTFVQSTQTEREDPQTVISDMLCDAMHWCDRNNVDFDKALVDARANHSFESQHHQA